MEKHCESRIDGSFLGWPGKGVYRLVNGQIWKQVNYKYQYKYAHRPNAIVWRDGSKYYLEVDGMDEMIEVRWGSIEDLQDDDA